jgi:hypothetical protein
MPRRLGATLMAGLVAVAVAGCGQDQAMTPPPLQATGSTTTCRDGQGYQHATLGYRLCFPNGWTSRDYTAEPGAGGALSIVAFGPPAAVPAHVPSETGFAPPVAVRVVAGAKDAQEASLVQGNPVTHLRVAGVQADRIEVTESGPAAGAVYVVLEHQGNTYEIEKAPGSTYAGDFQKVLDSFAFSAASS